MRIATWNIERLKHIARKDDLYRIIDKQRANILVLTETDSRIYPYYKYIEATPPLSDIKPDYYKDKENRVTVFSDYPIIEQYETYDNYTALCVEIQTDIGNLIVYGTIMGIFGNREKSFLPDLENQMDDIRRICANGYNVCVIGDYNLSFCDNYYYTKAGREMVLKTFGDCGIDILTFNRKECVDHIAVSKTFVNDCKVKISEWNLDKSLSDHKGIVVDF